MIPQIDEINSTADVSTPQDPFDRIIGQKDAVKLVPSAVRQRRHVLLCGVPGTGKSLIAKAAYSLLPPPRDEIILRANPQQPDRPFVIIDTGDPKSPPKGPIEHTVSVEYVHPDELPFDVAIELGYRCQRCGAFSYPDQEFCIDCGAPKRHDVTSTEAYHGLFRVLSVVREPALTSTHRKITVDGSSAQVTYERTDQEMVRVSITHTPHENQPDSSRHGDDFVLVPRSASRFIRISGSSPVELLGDVKHDPYGSAPDLATAPHMRVVPGAIHEAHEGILFIDELGTLGAYQKHLLTALQEKRYPITGHNPLSSGASVRVDDVPCDFILFAACNLEDLPKILPALRSRIRGYGYEIMLSSWFEKNEDHAAELLKFIAITVEEDGRIPHFSRDAVYEVLKVAEQMAQQIDGRRDAYTLRLRDLGGVIRIAGDLAVQEHGSLVDAEHVRMAETVSRGVGFEHPLLSYEGARRKNESYGDYFF